MALLTVLVTGALAGCTDGDSDDGQSSATASTAVSASSPSEATEPAPSGDTASDPVVVSPTDRTTSGGGQGGLPGEPIDGYWVHEGSVLGVIGVAFDDVLNVRAAPGPEQPIVDQFPPLTDDIVATGNSRILSSGSIWHEVETADGTGWVNSRYVTYVGGTNDLTSEVIDRLDGERPSAATMRDLGLVVAEALDYDDPAEGSTIVMTVPPATGDLGEVTFDVVGLADDALHGYRLHVFGTPTDDGMSFSLRSVEATLYCYRGVTDDGACV